MSASAKPESQETEETTLGMFFEQETVEKITDAAKIIEKLGFEPEIRLLGNGGIELYVKDIPSMIRTLRASIASNPKQA